MKLSYHIAILIKFFFHEYHTIQTRPKINSNVNQVDDWRTREKKLLVLKICESIFMQQTRKECWSMRHIQKNIKLKKKSSRQMAVRHKNGVIIYLLSSNNMSIREKWVKWHESGEHKKENFHVIVIWYVCY